MSNLKRDANRFLFKHRNKGIPNLMLFVGVGNLVVFVLSLILSLRGTDLFALLRFDVDSVLSGQVWRIFTYPFTIILGSGFFFVKLITLYFYFWVGKMLESIWGTLKLNLYYFLGLLLTTLAGILIPVLTGIEVLVTAYYVNLSLFLAVATLCPEEKVFLYFIIPVKMRWMALVYLALTVYGVASSVVAFHAIYGSLGIWYALIAYGVAPLISLIDYLLFFGRNAKNLFVRGRIYTTKKKPPEPSATPNPDWAKNYRSPSGERPYRHKCTVCGRTDTDCPDLEFRYCSKCAGYFCYCADHINNHTHVQ